MHEDNNAKGRSMLPVSRRRFVQGLAAGGAVAALDWRAGWVAGVGAEFGIASNVSIRSEVLYVAAGDRTFTFISPTLGPGNFAHSDSMWMARVGLNVKLGFDPAVPTY